MKSRRFTFMQKHSSGFIQRRLDYIFISNTFQELVTTTEILALVDILLLYSPLFQKENTVLEVKDFGNLIAP